MHLFLCFAIIKFDMEEIMAFVPHAKNGMISSSSSSGDTYANEKVFLYPYSFFLPFSEKRRGNNITFCEGETVIHGHWMCYVLVILQYSQAMSPHTIISSIPCLLENLTLHVYYACFAHV